MTGDHAAVRSDDLHTDARYAREQRGLPARAPQLQSQVARARFGDRRQSHRASHPSHFHAVDRADVTTVESISDAEQCGQSLDLSSEPWIERPIIPMLLFWPRPAVISSDVGYRDLFFGRETKEVRVQDQMIGMLVEIVIVDVISHIMEQRRVGQDIAITRRASDPVTDRVEEL